MFIYNFMKRVIGDNLPNIVQSAMAMIVGFNPLLSTIYSSYSTYSNNNAHKAIRKVLYQLSDKIDELENLVDRNYLQSDEFKNLSYRTFMKAVAEIREEKLIMFADFLARSALPINIEVADKYMFLETLDKIDVDHICFLNKLSVRSALNDVEKVIGWRGEEKDLIVLGVNQERFFLLCDYLANVGLISRIEKFEIIPESGMLCMTREYFVSYYGMVFLKFIGNSL